MRRRDLLILTGSATLAWPLSVRGQQRDKMRRIGVLAGGDENNPEQQARHAAFRQVLQQAGWTIGDNLKIDYRWGVAEGERIRRYALELAALAPDVILTTGGAGAEAMLRATRTTPIVFVIVPDPVGSGLVDSLSRPGGNATGFMMFEYNLCTKWPKLLKQIAPSVTRVGVLRDPAQAAGIGQFAVIQAVAPSLGIEVTPINVHDASGIERDVTAFARSSNDGLILTASGLGNLHRDLIIALAARYRLPAIYHDLTHAAAGGLIAYGTDFIDEYRRAAGYVDRILKGEKPGDLPVQAPARYELVINLKTAKSLGLTVPQALLARADEVIE
jgi:putative ABC transport system substrate-binding protein